MAEELSGMSWGGVPSPGAPHRAERGCRRASGFPGKMESKEHVLTTKAAARGAGKERMNDLGMSQFSSVQ